MKLGVAILVALLGFGAAFGVGAAGLGVSKLSTMKPESVRVDSAHRSRGSRGCGTCIYLGGRGGGSRYSGGGGRGGGGK